MSYSLVIFTKHTSPVTLAAVELLFKKKKKLVLWSDLDFYLLSSVALRH